jgi:hypothetical protein
MMASGHLRALRRSTAAVLATALLLGVVACAPPAAEPDAEPSALEVRMDGDVQPTVTVPATFEQPLLQDLSQLGTLSDVIFGTPVEITLDGDIPESGATLTRTYAAPLPEDSVGSFAFWDAEFQTWTAVPTTLSDDRRTVTAVVHHFSLWNDFVAGSSAAIGNVRDAAVNAGQTVTEWTGTALNAAGEGLTTAAEALHWSVGNIFTTRVELPECDLSTPNWVIDLPVSTEVDDPVRFCAGHDAADSELLVIKARANRGYGFPVALATDAAWEYNSTSESSLATTIATVGQVDAVIGESMAQLFNEGRYVGAGDEISFGIATSALRAVDAEYLLELPAPSIEQFVVGTVSQLLVGWGVSKTEGTLAAAIVVANCLSKLGLQRDVGTAAGTILTCATGAGDLLTKTLEKSLVAQGYGRTPAGKLIGKMSMALAFLPAAISTADYFAELAFPRNVRALTITVDPDKLKAPDDGWLISADGIGPARFDMSPEQANSAFGSRQLHCDGSAAIDWYATAWNTGPTGYMYAFASSGDLMGEIPGAPATAAGVTLGSSEDELLSLGYTRGDSGPYGRAFEWEEDGRDFAADTTPEGYVYAINVGSHYFPAGFCH